MRLRQGSTPAWLRSREMGVQPHLGHRDRISAMLYSSVDVMGFWEPLNVSRHDLHGGIFNFDFSTDGSVLVAACEGKSFLVFDPGNCKLVNTRRRAHTDCVNCVRFLDTRSFVTCSDDTTVVLWDLRFLKNSVRQFEGHSNWVKNIEYASSLGLLITSGFDGAVYTWNINNYSSIEERKRVFYTDGLMRCKLTSDDSKLILSTSHGYMFIVHNLDLPHLNIDLEGFKFGQTNGERFSTTMANFNSLFERDKNRLELINDFPEENNAEIIASLQVHPQGWCIASRNTSADEITEWTCVHDIHTQALKNDHAENDDKQEVHSSGSALLKKADSSARTNPPAVLGNVGGGFSLNSTRRARMIPSLTAHILSPRETGSVEGEGLRVELSSPLDSAANTSSDELDFQDDTDSDFSEDDIDRSPLLGEYSPTDEYGIHYLSGPRNLVVNGLSESDSLYNYFIWSQRPRTSSGPYMVGLARSGTGSSVDVPRLSTISNHLSELQRQRAIDYITAGQEMPRSRAQRRDFELSGNITPPELFTNQDRPIYKSKPRLIYSQQEPNVGRGFIKEQCFSTDGRLIVSPWGNGIRLLSFDQQCRELCDCEPPVVNKPRRLYELREISMHPQVVLTTCFSPLHPLFVSGSLDGSIAFLTPCP